MTRRRPSPFGVIAAALALFLVVFALLAVQMRNARVKAAATRTVAAAPAPRRILQRRVVVRRIVVRVVSGDDGEGRRVVLSAPAAVPAPVPAAPAPAPAPASPPLVTRTS